MKIVKPYFQMNKKQIRMPCATVLYGALRVNPSPAEPYSPCLCKQFDPDQKPTETNWSGSALFAINYVNLYQQSGLSNLIAWKLEVGMAS